MSVHEIVYVHGRRVWDSRGQPTLEAEVMLAGGAVGRAMAPAGIANQPSHPGVGEALDLHDGGESFGGRDVGRALASVNGEIAARLIGSDGADQAALDRLLVELDGTPDTSRLGANATIAVSMAAAHAAAAEAGVPLYRHLGGDEAGLLPLPLVQVFGAGSQLEVQDFMVVCPAAASFAEALDITAEVYRAAGELLRERGKLGGVTDEGGWVPAFDSNEQALDSLVAAIERAGFDPGTEVGLALDIAASRFGRDGTYSFAGAELSTDAMVETLAGWVARFPIASLEDPLALDDTAGFAAVTRLLGGRVQIVGDALLVTDTARIAAAAAQAAVTCAVLKPNQRGTLTETLAAWRALQSAGLRGIASARSGETEDSTIVHLAVGWGIGQLKAGGLARGERTAKWNEALRIEEALGPRGRFAGGADLLRSPR